MKLAMSIAYADDPVAQVDKVADYEKAGLDLVWVAEAYGYDAVSIMGYLAAITETIEIASGILPIYTRTPTLLAQTAAGVDAMSNGRCVLGLGASGPQVIEGWHGVPYTTPIARTRDIIEICRKVWKREERLTHDGRTVTLPLPGDQGTGLGKPLKIINHPKRADIPIYVASLGPKNVEMTAELANGWLPIFYVPEKAGDVWGDDLAAGQAKRAPELGPLEVIAGGMVAIGSEDEVGRFRDIGRPMAALYIGGMGAKGKNFYNDLVTRYGWEQEAEEIQDLYLSGHKDEAAAKIPDELMRATSLVGDIGEIADRIAAYEEAGVTYLNITPVGADPVKIIDQLKELIA
ncbi:MAG: LLM class F420-dependent oxidoreductase [Acidimicrobiia bacterium]|nr:LLM class F420-dependent oxidoreductase [Acidimicrobiia bacterium]